MKFSVLHISDLHQNLQDEIPPEVLLDTLENDFSRYAAGYPRIPLPSICVVSGDVVYGVAPGTKNASAELQRQYEQAHEFLIRLCDQFFNGDRDRIVIVPGNHDVDYSEVMSSGSFLPIPKSDLDKGRLVKELFSANTYLRWSWSRLEFFRVDNEGGYHNRLLKFAQFYERFYHGKRTYSLDPAQQYDVFDFPDLSFCLAALNSCHRNDPMNRVGTIHPSALSAACRELRKPTRAGWCLGASWHHDVSGGAGHEDFLDVSFLQLLVDAGVTVGFHGHRHRADCFDQKSRLGDTPRKMTVVAAGTLCAGPSNLNPGTPRGYNVIELDTAQLVGRVHSRQMVNQLQNLPIWGPGVFVDTNKSFMDFDLSPPIESRPASLDMQLTLERASDLFGRQQWREVITELESVAFHPLARPFYVKALEELGDDALTIQCLQQPQSVPEAVILGAAILESDAQQAALRFFVLDVVVANSDASLNEINSRLKRKFLR